MSNTSHRVERPIRLFLSSTYEDLREYREAVVGALDSLPNMVRDRMEIMGADPNTPKSVCLKHVRGARLFVLVLGMRYGRIDEETGKSLTQLEYEEAQKCNLKIWVYEIDPKTQPVLPIHMDTGKSADKLARFKELVEKRHTCDRFTTPDNLAVKVLRDIIPDVFRLAGVDYGPVTYDLGPLLRAHREDTKTQISTILGRVRECDALREVLPRDLVWFEDLELGKQTVGPQELPAIALAYEIEPSLLQALSANPVPDLVHLRSDGDFVQSQLLSSEVKKTFHSIARNRLQGSRVSILRVLLRKGGVSIAHRHLGEEILVGLRGEVSLLFPERTGAPAEVIVAAGEVLHFRSDHLHQARHHKGDPAETIAIRIINPRPMLDRYGIEFGGLGIPRT